MPNAPFENLDPWQWALIVFLAVVVIAVIGDVIKRLWHTPEPAALNPAPYDWAQHDEVLDDLARGDQAELVAVFPASWLHR